MADQPEALRLADRLEDAESARLHLLPYAAAELRRLHEAHDWQYKMAGDRLRRIEKLEAVNAELIAALKDAVAVIGLAENSVRCNYYKYEREFRALIFKIETQ